MLTLRVCEQHVDVIGDGREPVCCSAVCVIWVDTDGSDCDVWMRMCDGRTHVRSTCAEGVSTRGASVCVRSRRCGVSLYSCLRRRDGARGVT